MPTVTRSEICKTLPAPDEKLKVISLRAKTDVQSNIHSEVRHQL